MRRNLTNYAAVAIITLSLIAAGWNWRSARMASAKTALLLEEMNRQRERLVQDDPFKIRKSNSDVSIFAGQPVEDYLSRNKPPATHGVGEYTVYGFVFTPNIGWPFVICRNGKVMRCQTKSCFGLYIDFDIFTKDEVTDFERALEEYRKLSADKGLL